MARLSVAIDTAKESIGKGLVDGLILATGSASIDDLQSKIVNLGTNLAAIFVATGNLIYENWFLIKQLGIALIAAFTAAKVYAGVIAFIALVKKLKVALAALRATGFAAAVATMAAINPVGAVFAAGALVTAIIAGNKVLDKFNESKSEAEKPFKAPDFSGLTTPNYGDAKRLEDLKIKAAKAQEKAAKESIKLQKLSKVFDLSYIQIYAALQGQLSEEERTRVRLQLALLEENVGAADHLSKKLADSQGQTSMLSTFLRTLPDAKNPFEKWGDYLKAIELEAKRIGAMSFTTAAADGTAAQPFGVGGALGLEDLRGQSAAVPQINITVELDGQTVGGAIREGQINDSLSGSFNQVNRGSGFKGAIAI
jgi:hypothetical protein